VYDSTAAGQLAGKQRQDEVLYRKKRHGVDRQKSQMKAASQEVSLALDQPYTLKGWVFFFLILRLRRGTAQPLCEAGIELLGQFLALE
jgi:hypothetical protein